MPIQRQGKRSKASKKDQPKRKRYNVQQRGFKRRITDLEKHIKKNPNDAQALVSLPEVQKMRVKGHRKKSGVIKRHYLGYGGNK